MYYKPSTVIYFLVDLMDSPPMTTDPSRANGPGNGAPKEGTVFDQRVRNLMGTRPLPVGLDF